MAGLMLSPPHGSPTVSERPTVHISRIVPALLLGLLLSHILPVRAQVEEEVLPLDPRPNQVISAVGVLGNELTKAEIILRELTLRVGDTIDVAELEYSKNRIYSLGLFNRVDITWPPIDSTVLIIEVDERWYLYPVPMAGIVERNWDHWYYGLGVKHDNFRGRNEKLFAGFVLGYNPWVSLSYVNPWILGDQHMFMESNFAWSRVVNKSRISQGEGPNFNEIRYRLHQGFGKRIDQFRSAWITASYNYVEVTDKQAGRTLSEAGIDRYLTVGAGARHDTRNLSEYPTSGFFGMANVAKKGVWFGAVDFMQWSFDIRAYQLLPAGLSLGLRTFAVISSGPSIPNYEHVFFGFSERIRGHFETELEGENIGALFAELRIPIVPRLYIHVPEVPIRQFRTWKLGLYAAVFADAGMVWDRKDRPDISTASKGYGAGLHFLFPYSTVFRVDRAWDESGRGQWVFDVGASF
jgi:outer membrane protein assembly factor BamA